MKRLLIMGVTLFLLFALTNCGKHHGDPSETSETNPATGEPEVNETHSLSNEELSVIRENLIVDPVPVSLDFSSLEELKEAYKLVRAGKADGELAKLTKSVNFAELEKLYLPTGVPEPYQLHKISVYKDSVQIRYSREEDLISGDTIKLALEYFNFIYSRSDPDYSLKGLMQQYGVAEKDLIDGKYLFRERSYTLFWQLDGGLMSLKLPTSLEVFENKISVVEYLGLKSVDELARFAELQVIDLIG